MTKWRDIIWVIEKELPFALQKKFMIKMMEKYGTVDLRIVKRKFIALQCAVILAWLTPYLDGSSTDTLQSMVSEKMAEYKAVAGNEYVDYNKGSNRGL
jgi:hypothetical protein